VVTTLRFNAKARFNSVIPFFLVPAIIQSRAWECAYALREDFADRLTLAQRVEVEVAYRSDPLGWAECGDMLHLYSAIAGVRV
jgi:hypothetical protein